MLMTPTSRDTQKDAAMREESLHEPMDSLSIELGRISAEIQSINSGFQAQMQDALADARAAIQVRALAEARASLEVQYRERFDKAIEEVQEQVRLDVGQEF